jgi:hypothetical protein
MAAIDAFRRTMRRLEKRARRMRIRDARVATGFWCARMEGWADAATYRAWASERRKRGDRRVAFLYDRAADAVARLLAAQGGP